jgi:hypothetical protein
MQRSDWSRIAHGDLEFMGPYDETSFERAANGERYAAQHLCEPGLAEFLESIRNGRRRYTELDGRDTLGFALILFRKDQADP